MRNYFSRALTSLSILGLTFLTHQAAFAGERLQFDVVQSNAKEVVSVYLQGSEARIVSSANSTGAVIFNANNRKLRVLDHGRKTVTVVDQSTMEQLASVAEGVGNLARAQGGVLGDLFETFGFDNQMGAPVNIEIKQIAGKKQFSGQACQMQQILKDGQVVTQICLSEQINLGATERDTLGKLISFAQLMAQKAQIVLKQFKLAIPTLPTQALSGVPVYVENKVEGVTATLSSVKQVTIPAAQFKIPVGYTETVLGL